MDNEICLLAPNAGVGGGTVGTGIAILLVGVALCMYIAKKQHIRPGLFFLALALGVATSLQFVPQSVFAASDDCLAAKPDSSVGAPGQLQVFNVLNNDTPSAGARFVGSSLRLELPENPLPGSFLSMGNRMATTPTEGSYQANANGGDGTITFTPEASFRGMARGIRYTVQDTAGNTTGSVYIPRVIEGEEPVDPGNDEPGDLQLRDRRTEYFYSGESDWSDLTEAEPVSTNILPNMAVQFSSLASSGDGSKLIAGTLNGYVYISTDGGVSWTEKYLGQHTWSAVSSSIDGSKLAITDADGATNNGGYIYTSDDGGSTWVEQIDSGEHGWKSIAASGDGVKLVAADYNSGYIYTSNDSGANWNAQISAGARTWQSVASSNNGSKLVAAHNGGYLYTSIDSGTTWNPQVSAGARYWASVTSSADGVKLAAVDSNGHIHTSADSGGTWTPRANDAVRYWSSIASSADGVKLAATVNNGYIYTSLDSGVTWIEQSGAGQRGWNSITMNSGGSQLVATEDYGFIYTSNNSGLAWQIRNDVLLIDPYDIDIDTALPGIQTTVNMASQGWSAVYDPATDTFSASVTNGPLFLAASQPYGWDTRVVEATYSLGSNPGAYAIIRIPVSGGGV